MKINRMIGLLIFLFIAQFLLKDVFHAVSRTTVAALETVETASKVTTKELSK